MIPTPVFGKKPGSNDSLKRDDEAKKSHHALARFLARLILPAPRTPARSRDAFQRALLRKHDPEQLIPVVGKDRARAIGVAGSTVVWLFRRRPPEPMS